MLFAPGICVFCLGLSPETHEKRGFPEGKPRLAVTKIIYFPAESKKC
ncbi:hypothetical protein IMSAGC014_02038 [Bacteroidaceae bacterium]|nr:hypothetical protein IMSAGC014_02038 [Bacteroidaceae bacterium]